VGRLNSGRAFEAGAIAIGLAVVCAIVFHAGSGTVTSGFLPAIIYAPIPLLIWAAVRFGQRGASGAILVLTVVSIWQNVHESSVFIGTTPDRNVLALQVFLLGVAIPLFFLGAVIDELKQAGEVMRALAGELLHVQDEERRRIARELHDSTGQNLAVAGLLVSRIQKASPTSFAPVLTEIHEILQKAMADIRTVSYLLHPPFLSGVGLDSALRSYLDGFTKRSGLHVELNVPPDFERMPSSIELALFRVVQEALANVWRHSGSDTAQIHLQQWGSSNERGVILSIEDFGKGIPEDVRQATLSTKTTKYPAETGLGLLSMRERLHQIGGALEIHSKLGHTVIRAIVKSIPPEPPDRERIGENSKAS
jgi:signal transduction histidine kinase